MRPYFSRVFVCPYVKQYFPLMISLLPMELPSDWLWRENAVSERNIVLLAFCVRWWVNVGWDAFGMIIHVSGLLEADGCQRKLAVIIMCWYTVATYDRPCPPQMLPCWRCGMTSNDSPTEPLCRYYSFCPNFPTTPQQFYFSRRRISASTSDFNLGSDVQATRRECTLCLCDLAYRALSDDCIQHG